MMNRIGLVIALGIGVAACGSGADADETASTENAVETARGLAMEGSWETAPTLAGHAVEDYTIDGDRIWVVTRDLVEMGWPRPAATVSRSDDGGRTFSTLGTIPWLPDNAHIAAWSSNGVDTVFVTGGGLFREFFGFKPRFLRIARLTEAT